MVDCDLINNKFLVTSYEVYTYTDFEINILN